MPLKTRRFLGLLGLLLLLLAGGCIRVSFDVAGYVWSDLNGNGIQDPLEPPLAGVPVALVDSNGQEVWEPTVTGEDGTYSFALNGVPNDFPTEVFVQATLPDGEVLVSPQFQGSDRTLDSDFDGDGRSPAIALAPGEGEANRDFTNEEGDQIELDLGLMPHSALETQEHTEEESETATTTQTTEISGNTTATGEDGVNWVINWWVFIDWLRGDPTLELNIAVEDEDGNPAEGECRASSGEDSPVGPFQVHGSGSFMNGMCSFALLIDPLAPPGTEFGIWISTLFFPSAPMLGSFTVPDVSTNGAQNGAQVTEINGNTTAIGGDGVRWRIEFSGSIDWAQVEPALELGYSVHDEDGNPAEGECRATMAGSTPTNPKAVHGEGTFEVGMCNFLLPIDPTYVVGQELLIWMSTSSLSSHTFLDSFLMGLVGGNVAENGAESPDTIFGDTAQPVEVTDAEGNRWRVEVLLAEFFGDEFDLIDVQVDVHDAQGNPAEGECHGIVAMETPEDELRGTGSTEFQEDGVCWLIVPISGDAQSGSSQRFWFGAHFLDTLILLGSFFIP